MGAGVFQRWHQLMADIGDLWWAHHEHGPHPLERRIPGSRITEVEGHALRIGRVPGRRPYLGPLSPQSGHQRGTDVAGGAEEGTIHGCTVHM